MAASLAFPFGDGIEPELNESERAGEFGAGELDDVGIGGEIFEAFANVGSMERPADGMGDVVELFGHENAFVAGIRRRFGETRIIDVIGGAPWEIGPVRTGFEDVVLKIIFVEENQTALVAKIGELFETAPIPRIVLGEVIPADAIPRGALAATRERQFVERRPDVPAHPANALMVVAAAVVPKAVMMIESGNPVGGKGLGKFGKIVSEAGADATWDKAGDAGFGERRFSGTKTAAPPGDVSASADEQATIAGEPAVRNTECGMRNAE